MKLVEKHCPVLCKYEGIFSRPHATWFDVLVIIIFWSFFFAFHFVSLNSQHARLFRPSHVLVFFSSVVRFCVPSPEDVMM